MFAIGANPWIWIIILTFTLISLGVVALLPEEHLVPIYWVIAISGIAWPWMAIGVALTFDLLTRSAPMKVEEKTEVRA